MAIKLLSDCSANFTSALVEEFCSAFVIQGCGTAMCHAQCNGQQKGSPDIILNDRKIGLRQQGSMGASALRADAGL